MDAAPSATRKSARQSARRALQSVSDKATNVADDQKEEVRRARQIAGRAFLVHATLLH